MKGLIGNSRDQAYIVSKGYKAQIPPSHGLAVYEKGTGTRLQRLIINYMTGNCELLVFDHQNMTTTPIGKPKRFRVANLQEYIL